MTKPTLMIVAIVAALLAGPAVGDSGKASIAKTTIGAKETNEELVRQVREAETGFAATMAARDKGSFASYV